jgi:dihydroflavonol-4-reductase
MTVLVTGATGFLGSAVARTLVQDGHTVRCLVRKGCDLSNLVGLPLDYAQGDVTDLDAVRQAVQGCDQVIHLAAIYAMWMKDFSLMYRVNVNGTYKVLTACRDAGVKKVVHVSSVAALGAHSGLGQPPANESVTFNLAHAGAPYFITKYQSEQVALDFAAKGLPVTIVNPTVILGPNDRLPTPSGAMILNVLKGKLPGYIRGGMNLVDVRDCARGTVNALERGRVGEKYILGNRNVEMKEFFDLIVRVAGHGKSPRIKFPVFMAVQSAYAEELIAWLTGKSPVNTAAWVRVGSQYLWWDSAKAVKELGLPQRPAEESIADAIAWFRGKGLL